MDDIKLRLFVCGRSVLSDQAVSNLQALCEEKMKGQSCNIDVVDVLERPEAAQEANVLATPTLMRIMPPPYLRVIGDLSDTSQLLASLDL